MLIGALLILTWLVLLLRYPAKALPISLAAVAWAWWPCSWSGKTAAKAVDWRAWTCV